MSNKIALPALVLLASSGAVALTVWTLRRAAPSPLAAEVSSGLPAQASFRDGNTSELRAPGAPTVASTTEVEAKSTPPEPQSILEENAEHWERRYKDVPLVQLERELADLRATFKRQSDPEFDLRFDGGQYELVEGATEPHNEPWKPGAFVQVERPGGEAADQVHRVVLYQREAPELYSLAAKMYWLEQRIVALGSR
jgi:hypothetical protein